jgi:hypothetical protein
MENCGCNQVFEIFCKCGQSRGIIETAVVAFFGKSAFELTLGSFNIGPQLTRHGVTVWYNMENHSDTSVSQTRDRPPSKRPHQSPGIPALGDTICG